MQNVDLKIPVSWAEITPDQLRYLAKLFLLYSTQVKAKFLAYALIRFSGLKVIGKKGSGYLVRGRDSKKFTLTSRQVMNAMKRLDWLLSTVEEIRPLPRIMWTLCCHRRMYNTPFIQFLTAENFFMAYEQTRDMKYLRYLAATIYRNPGQRFNEKKVKRRSWKYSFVKDSTLFTIFLWYGGFRWYVAKECPHVFGRGGSSGGMKVKEHIMAMIRGLTEGDVTKAREVEKVDTWDALYELDAKAKHSEELQRKIKKR